MSFYCKFKRPKINGSDSVVQKIFVKRSAMHHSKLSREGLSNICRSTVVITREGWTFISTVQSPYNYGKNNLNELINPIRPWFWLSEAGRTKLFYRDELWLQHKKITTKVLFTRHKYSGLCLHTIRVFDRCQDQQGALDILSRDLICESSVKPGLAVFTRQTNPGWIRVRRVYTATKTNPG